MAIREVGSVMFCDVTRTAVWHGQAKWPEVKAPAAKPAPRGESTPTVSKAQGKVPPVIATIAADPVLKRLVDLVDRFLHPVQDRLEDEAAKLWGGQWVVTTMHADDRGRSIVTFHKASARMADYVREHRFGRKHLPYFEEIIEYEPCFEREFTLPKNKELAALFEKFKDIEIIPGKSSRQAAPPVSRYRTRTRTGQREREPDPPLFARVLQKGLVDGCQITTGPTSEPYTVLEVNPLAALCQPGGKYEGSPAHVIPMHIIAKHWRVVEIMER